MVSIRRGIAILLLVAWSSSHADDVTVVGQGSAALISAVEAANRSGRQTTILLGGTYQFGPNQRIPRITGDVSLVSALSRATFEPVDGGPQQLIDVAVGARLLITGVRIRNFPLSHIRNHDGPLILNQGDLAISQSQFENLTGRTGGGFCCFEDRDPAIVNQGHLVVDRTSFLDVAIESFQGSILVNDGGTAELTEVLTASRSSTFAVAIANRAGHLRITNATFGAEQGALRTEPGAVTEMGNTIIRRMPDQIPPEGLPEGWAVNELQACSGPIDSLGHNLVADESCDLGGPGDVQGHPTGTFPVSLERDPLGDHLVPVIGLAAASLAVDSADPSLCGAADLLNTARIIDGNHDGVRGCDRGAVELSQRRITEGGITGFYHVPAHDGHYIHVLQNHHNVLVVWNTFDLEGNQAWIFATGELANGRSIIADAYTNENGVLTDMGPVDIDRAIPWGTITLELQSCNRGRLLFDTDRPGFVSGEIQFQRLASSRQLGCAD